jgi:uncharacterized protein (DUF1330 family)
MLSIAVRGALNAGAAMSAYAVMIRDRLTDPEEFATYQKLAGQARGDNPPKPLAFYGVHETVEGPPADGIVILEFPSMDAAKAWYNSDGYQGALPHRLAGAEYRVMFVEGV